MSVAPSSLVQPHGLGQCESIQILASGGLWIIKPQDTAHPTVLHSSILHGSQLEEPIPLGASYGSSPWALSGQLEAEAPTLLV